MKRNWMVSFFKRRRRTYSVLSCVLATILCVCLCLCADALTRKYALSADMSFNGISTQSDVTRGVIASLTVPVHVYALMTTGNEDVALIAALSRYAAASPMITYSVVDIVRNPVLLAAFPGEIGEAATSECLIVHCERTDRYKVVPSTAYLSYGYDTETEAISITGIAYEKSLTEAIAYVSSDTLPTVSFLTGHNELDENATLTFEQLLTSQNCTSERVNLIKGGTLDPTRVLAILSPQKDLTYAELNAIEAFAAAGGAMLLTCDYTDILKDMPNYSALLRSYGIVPLEGVVVASPQDEGSYYSNYPAILVPVMTRVAATSALLDTGLDTLLMEGARAFDTPMQSDDLTVDVLLFSRDHAYLRDFSDGNLDLAQRDTDFTGKMPLAMLATRSYENGTFSRAVMIGCSPLLINSAWYSNTDNAAFAVQMLGTLGCVSKIDLNIPAKTALHPGVPANASTQAALIPVILLPVLVAAAALCVLLPRRNL